MFWRLLVPDLIAFPLSTRSDFVMMTISGDCFPPFVSPVHFEALVCTFSFSSPLSRPSVTTYVGTFELCAYMAGLLAYLPLSDVHRI